MSTNNLSFCGEIRKISTHHNLFITLLLGSKVKTVLTKQPRCIQTKMSTLYRKMTIYGHFLYNLDIFVWIQHFRGPPLNPLISETSNNELSYKGGPVYFWLEKKKHLLWSYTRILLLVCHIPTPLLFHTTETSSQWKPCAPLSQSTWEFTFQL